MKILKTKLYQWDTNQSITGLTGLYVDFVANESVYRVDVSEGTCAIPDEVLQLPGIHRFYECFEDHTMNEYSLRVIERLPPPDYAYTPTRHITFEELVGRVDALVLEIYRRADSGEFDGPPGQDYVITEADYHNIAEIVEEEIEAVKSVNNIKPDKSGNVDLKDLGNVHDVQIEGTTILNQTTKVANIPYADDSRAGVITASRDYLLDTGINGDIHAIIVDADTFRNTATNGRAFVSKGTLLNYLAADYLTKSSASSTYATKTSLNNYLTIATAASTYATKTSLNNYLTTTDASNTYATKASLSNYLTTTDASNTYATKASLNNYLTTATAASTYATKASLSNYLTTTDASNTYATKASLSNYLTTTDAATIYISNDDATRIFLSKNDASDQYATKTSLNNYLAKTEAEDTFAGIDSRLDTLDSETLTLFQNVEDINDRLDKLEFVKIVDELPETGEPNIVYFVPKTDTKESDLFDEYMWINSKWEFLGTKTIDVDLSEYAKKTYVDTELTNALQSKQDLLKNTINIKSVNGESILGAGNIEIQSGSSVSIIDNPIGGVDITVGDVTKTVADQDQTIVALNELSSKIDNKQDILTSGENIKTINGESVLGSGNIEIQGGSTDAYTKAETDDLLNYQLDQIESGYDKAQNVSVGVRLNDAGKEVADSAWCVSEHIPIVALSTVTWQYGARLTSACLCGYNAAGIKTEYWGNSSASNRTVTLVGADTVTIRVSFRISEVMAGTAWVKLTDTGEIIFTPQIGRHVYGLDEVSSYSFVAERLYNNDTVLTDDQKLKIETWLGLSENYLTTYNETPYQVTGDYNPAHKKYVDGLVNELQLFKFPNATIIGEPTINNGQISGFSATSYLKFPFLVDFNSRPFEINMEFTTGSNVTSQENIFDSDFGLAFAIRNSRFVIAISTNGTSWNLGEGVGTYTVLANTTYRVKLWWDRMTYHLSYSVDGGNTYTEDITKVGAFQPAPKQMYIGVGETFATVNNHFTGIINMNHCNLSINGQLIWQGMDDAGLATRLEIDMSNIDQDGIATVKRLANDSEISELTTTDKTVIGAINELDANAVRSDTMENNTIWLGTKDEYDALPIEMRTTKDVYITTDEPYASMEDVPGFGGEGIILTIGDESRIIPNLVDLRSLFEVQTARANVSGKVSTAITTPAELNDGEYKFLCWVGVGSTGFVGSPYLGNYFANSTTVWDSKYTTDTALSYVGYALYVRSFV